MYVILALIALMLAFEALAKLVTRPWATTMFLVLIVILGVVAALMGFGWLRIQVT